MEGLINEDENLIFETKPKLFSIGIITISYEIVSLLNTKGSEVRVNGKCDLEQQALDQGTTKMVISTTNTIKFHVKPKNSLEDKVYPKTYYHHNQVHSLLDGYLGYHLVLNPNFPYMRYEVHSFLNGYLGYHQISIAPEDRQLL
jgi:hypothetical protein